MQKVAQENTYIANKPNKFRQSCDKMVHAVTLVQCECKRCRDEICC